MRILREIMYAAEPDGQIGIYVRKDKDCKPYIKKVSQFPTCIFIEGYPIVIDEEIKGGARNSLLIRLAYDTISMEQGEWALVEIGRTDVFSEDTGKIVDISELPVVYHRHQDFVILDDLNVEDDIIVLTVSGVPRSFDYFTRLDVYNTFIVDDGDKTIWVIPTKIVDDEYYYRELIVGIRDAVAKIKAVRAEKESNSTTDDIDGGV